MDLHNEPRWQWPSRSSPNPLNSKTDQPSEDAGDPNGSDVPGSEDSERHYPPRVCRICLETVLPTFRPPSENLPEFLQSRPRVVYESSDPESGRLLRPCMCKGSSRFVHEGCLQTWRHADPAYGKRNYWQCPTCKFQYRLERLRWGRWISSAGSQLILTLGILLLTVFLFGFIADPIINLYVDPLDTIYYADVWDSGAERGALRAEQRRSWVEHFVKGLASLGLLSFIKAILASSPLTWLNLRSSGVVGGGRNTGRSRVASLNWAIILIGVGTFLWAVYKGVKALCRRTLEKAGERVMDVRLPEDDDEDEIHPSGRTPQRSKKDD
ncbi:hypothetical protein ASPWEDRAFT_35499 [Aspergillus wentii DTO 134E9]|uniref:RING-CH-type domain-containing protein n=1 Tax=Aspergillus wentii DTO 134E9 TaxID=1073089 RepID=A0A1L9S417_ASPWE|nr:uncharacterized protein ASPWEDRAFT_35499 [Aspergillus wentii DTO 134E9]KAI9930207.1 hypothetical protein MW887_012019 [Aspergillus wentii]OJJ41881.1 hypothetical protein ASPWEDRAFT_35499 [Aspergillus wentii DTO 134E9]